MEFSRVRVRIRVSFTFNGAKVELWFIPFVDKLVDDR